MIFIDLQNLQINIQEYYKHNPKLEKPRIQYQKLTQQIINQIDFNNLELIKTYLFASKPCEELLLLPQYKNFYQWLNGMKNKPHFEVIEGSQVLRNTNEETPIDINNPSTFTTVEKGTDVNIAVNMLAKAYANAYDVAILVSGDTDYLPVVYQLNNIGKVVILVTLPHQNIAKYKGMYDQHIRLHDKLLQECV